MTSFDDLVERPDEELRILIRGLTPSTLAMALKNAPKEVTVKFYMNMSRGAGSLVEDMIEKLQSPTADEIATEQKRVIESYLALKAGGKFDEE